MFTCHARKLYKDGGTKKYKTCLVALGYGQVSGVDVLNTFAPVVKSIVPLSDYYLHWPQFYHAYASSVTRLECSLFADIKGDLCMCHGDVM